MAKDYEKDLWIDQEQLDVEWLNQPSLFMQYAELAAQAEKEKQEAKEALNLVRAGLDGEIREQLKRDKAKSTEAIVEAHILQNDHYKHAASDYIEARYNYDIMSAAVKAFDQRKSALEYLVKLWLGSYFASPKSQKKTDGDSVHGKALDGASKRQRKNLNKSKD